MKHVAQLFRHCFCSQVVHHHFWVKRHEVLKQCEEWIAEMEQFSNDKRTGRSISHSTMALKVSWEIFFLATCIDNTPCDKVHWSNKMAFASPVYRQRTKHSRKMCNRNA